MNTSLITLETELRESLERQHGPLLAGTALRQALGYPSAAAFRQACRREQLPVAVFRLPNRRGRFALSREVAAWLARSRLDAEDGEEHTAGKGGDMT